MSLRQRAMNLYLRLFVKPAMRAVASPRHAQRVMDGSMRLLLHPPHVRRIDRPGRISWIGVGRTATRPVLLYFHGGGYVAGSPATHQGMLGRLSMLTGLEVCAPDYRLAQEAPFPAAFDDAVRAWKHLMTLEYRPSEVILGGDSAGGGLALALLAWCLGRGQRPRGLFAFSPWTDLTLSGASLRANRRRDVLLPAGSVGRLVDAVLAGEDPADPRISPLFAEFSDCPPVLLQFSDAEILRDDSARMAERLGEYGAEVELQEWRRCPHVWPLFDGYFPEARAGLSEVARWLTALSPGPDESSPPRPHAAAAPFHSRRDRQSSARP